MNLVGKVSGIITQGMYSVATPFHPFGGAVDIIVVKQEDGTFRSTPWYVRFGKFQGVLKGAEKLVRIEVNGVEADFALHLDNSGEAYFVKEVDYDKDDDDNRENVRADIKSDLKENHLIAQDSNEFDVDVRDERVTLGMERLERVESDANRIFYEFEDELSSVEGSVDYSEYGSSRYDNLESVERALESESSSSEVVLVSVDGHILTAPLSSSELDADAGNVELSTAQFHHGPGEVTEEYNRDESACNAGYLDDLDSSCKVTTDSLGDSNKATLFSEEHQVISTSSGMNRDMVFKSCLELQELAVDPTKANKGTDTDYQHDKTEEENLEISKVNEETDTEDQHDETEEEKLEISKANEGTDTEEQHDKSEEENLEISAHENEIHENEFNVDIYGTEDQLNKTEDQHDKNDVENLEISTHEDEIHENEVNADTDVIEDQDDNTGQQLDRTEEENLEISTQENEINENEFHVHANGTDSKHVPFVSNGEALESLKEIDVAVKRMDSGEKVLASEDECRKSEHAEEPANGASNEDLKSECRKSEHAEEPANGASHEDLKSELLTKVEISLCGNLLQAGMGSSAAAEVFETNLVSLEEFKLSATSIMKNENLIVRLKGRHYLPWEKAAHIIVSRAAFGLDLPIDDMIPVEQDQPEGAKEDDPGMTSPPSRRWRLWSMPFRRGKTLEHSGSNSSTEEVFVDSESIVSMSPKSRNESPRKQIVRTNVPTTEQIESLNLKEGQNMVNFVFSTRVLGSQKVEAHIYLWKWNTKIVISDVDGTITKSDVLGQFMPLVGKDWTHSGIARLFCAIKENGYQLLFLSARAIVQAYLTKSFLFNLKQDGKSLPTGPVVISPDGLFPSLYREVIRRAPHEFKIACLEDIKALFPPGHNPFYAGFGNRDTDELSYRKIGIPKGKIFIINPKGEVAINHRIDVKSYTSLHTLVHDMFPPTELVEEEDYNAWNYWKMPLPDIDDM